MPAGVLKQAVEAGEEKVLESIRPKPVADTIEDGFDVARRAVKRGLYAAEAKVEDAVHEMKRHPFRTVATGFAAGVVIGAMGGWLMSRMLRR